MARWFPKGPRRAIHTNSVLAVKASKKTSPKNRQQCGRPRRSFLLKQFPTLNSSQRHRRGHGHKHQSDQSAASKPSKNTKKFQIMHKWSQRNGDSLSATMHRDQCQSQTVNHRLLVYFCFHSCAVTKLSSLQSWPPIYNCMRCVHVLSRITMELP